MKWKPSAKKNRFRTNRKGEAMPNPQDIFQLAQQTATQVTASPENWRRFLYTAAHNYHTTYLNQLLIHAQRPDATACATMKYWNEQAHRKVMYGSKSMIILQRHQGVPTAKRVFSMTDTVLTGDKAASPVGSDRCHPATSYAGQLRGQLNGSGNRASCIPVRPCQPRIGDIH